MTMPASLSPDTLYNLLGRRDLTDPRQGEHVLQQFLQEIHSAVGSRLNVPRRLCRIPAVRRQSTGNDARIAIRLSSECSGPPPEALEMIALDDPSAVLLVCPGPVFGRTDDGHIHLHGHRLAMWYLGQQAASTNQFPELVQTAIQAALPNQQYRLMPASFAGLRSAFFIEARGANGWVRCGHCGIGCNQETDTLGVVMELEPLLVLRKNLPDAAPVDGTSSAVQSQMQDLSTYRPQAAEQQA